VIDLRVLAGEFLDKHPHSELSEVEFLGAQYDVGLAWPHFPQGLGGCGATSAQISIVVDVFSSRGVPFSNMARNPIGYGMAAPTLLSWATPEVSRCHLRRIFTGEEIWCQMFSEPSSGSDLAGLSSRAVRDGDEWIINGQKVWTSLAHKASYALVLVRTDPNVPKHRGLSYFFVDMRTKGIDVVPLVQLTGDAEFNEVFLDSVRVPDANMLGQPGEGWRVATTTLMNERVAIGSSPSTRATPGESLLAAWKAKSPTMTDPSRSALRSRLLKTYVDAEVTRMAAARAGAATSSGVPGPEGSIAKLASAELSQRVAELIADMQGSDLMIHADGYGMVRAEGKTRSNSPVTQFLRSRASTIEGGTSEVMRNILGERVLGLPPDVRVDRDVAWSEIPR
jgi:alkylation response protein AidB-like acyl-CoA dehydrogenase